MRAFAILFLFCYVNLLQAAQSMPLTLEEFAQSMSRKLPVKRGGLRKLPGKRGGFSFQRFSGVDGCVTELSDNPVSLGRLSWSQRGRSKAALNIMVQLVKEDSGHGCVLRVDLADECAGVAHEKAILWSRPLPGVVSINKQVVCDPIEKGEGRLTVRNILPSCGYSGIRYFLNISCGENDISLRVQDSVGETHAVFTLPEGITRESMQGRQFFEPQPVLCDRMFYLCRNTGYRVFCVEQNTISWSKTPQCLAIIAPNEAKSFDDPGVYRVMGSVVCQGSGQSVRVKRVLDVCDGHKISEVLPQGFITVLPGFGAFKEEKDQEGVRLLMPYSPQESSRTFMEITYDRTGLCVMVRDDNGCKLKVNCDPQGPKDTGPVQRPSWFFVKGSQPLDQDTSLLVRGADQVSFIRGNFAFNAVWSEQDPCPLVRCVTPKGCPQYREMIVFGEILQGCGKSIVLYLCDTSDINKEGTLLLRHAKESLYQGIKTGKTRRLFLKAGDFLGNQHVPGFSGTRCLLPYDIRSEERYYLSVDLMSEGPKISVTDGVNTIGQWLLKLNIPGWNLSRLPEGW